VFEVARHDAGDVLDLLWEREIKRHPYRPRLVRARTPRGQVPALTFVADPAQPGYAGPLSVGEASLRVANCRGERGPNLEYLTRTVGHLCELGVHDHFLHRVLIAARALAAKRR
jgi:cation transport protein ChaC